MPSERGSQQVFHSPPSTWIPDLMMRYCYNKSPAQNILQIIQLSFVKTNRYYPQYYVLVTTFERYLEASEPFKTENKQNVWNRKPSYIADSLLSTRLALPLMNY